MKRAVKSLQPFAFQADFSPQPVAEDTVSREVTHGEVTLSTAELVQFLAQARAEGAAEVVANRNREDIQRLQGAIDSLNEALADLVRLAGHLEASAYEDDLKQSALPMIRAVAQRIIDGQGDLFTEHELIGASLAEHDSQPRS